MGWLAIADTSDRSRNLTHGATTYARHDRRHRGKQQEHEQRHETGGPSRSSRDTLRGVTARSARLKRSRTPNPQIRRLVPAIDLQRPRLNRVSKWSKERGSPFLAASICRASGSESPHARPSDAILRLALQASYRHRRKTLDEGLCGSSRFRGIKARGSRFPARARQVWSAAVP
jgi:hypothetical protein